MNGSLTCRKFASSRHRSCGAHSPCSLAGQVRDLLTICSRTKPCMPMHCRTSCTLHPEKATQIVEGWRHDRPAEGIPVL